MTRTLTAGTRTEPRAPRQPVDCADVVAGLWISVERMWLKAERYRKVVKAIRDTRAKLEDPRLRDHPKRPDAEARMEGWRLELRDLEVKAEPYRRGVARQWDGIPERVHRFLRDSGGWPEGEGGKEIAAGLWRYAVEDRPWPGGECPF